MPKKKYPKITKKDLEEGVKKWKEENEWEEFEEYAFLGTEYGDFRIFPEKTTIGSIVKKYLSLPTQLEVNNYPYDLPKILIKARKGEIVIKKLEE